MQQSDTVALLITNSPPLTEPKGSWPCSKQRPHSQTALTEVN